MNRIENSWKKLKIVENSWLAVMDLNLFQSCLSCRTAGDSLYVLRLVMQGWCSDIIGSFLLLEHNLFKNASNWVIFLWDKQIQTIKYGLNDAKRIKKKQDILILYSYTPSDINFQTSLLAKVILAKRKSQKIYSLRPFLS